jgi:AcrR family transcriptional regulator
MPKISAPTVAEHRAAQRTALMRAGEEVLVSSGLDGFTPAAVTARAGLARSSFYDYFPSKGDLLVAIAIDAMEQWNAELEQVLAEAEPGLPELHAFVDATMAMTADGRHTLAGVVRDAPIGQGQLERLMELHDLMLRPVSRVLRDVGADASGTSLALVQGVLNAGIQLVDHGADHREIAEHTFRLLTRGLIERPA